MAYGDTLGASFGKENTYGAVDGRVQDGPMTFARITTDDVNGEIRAYVGEGMFTSDPLDTFGTRAVAEVPELQKLLRYICENGFEHHVAMSASHSAEILAEALETYLGWELHCHR